MKLQIVQKYKRVLQLTCVVHNSQRNIRNKKRLKKYICSIVVKSRVWIFKHAIFGQAGYYWVMYIPKSLGDVYNERIRNNNLWEEFEM